ncbi:hypothetical protein BIW11_08854 [Tropilaelaps mercedesae]|uniref:Uncharacterized protein n=1 Tax=Tropilaelaps mercedesae TaxID=418985 RepID=A0A1V9XMQ9_9ACAR|nr:hypothetical protein BIW11_08854 [Tropilaelaps mercedesae]
MAGVSLTSSVNRDKVKVYVEIRTKFLAFLQAIVTDLVGLLGMYAHDPEKGPAVRALSYLLTRRVTDLSLSENQERTIEQVFAYDAEDELRLNFIAAYCESAVGTVLVRLANVFSASRRPVSVVGFTVVLIFDAFRGPLAFRERTSKFRRTVHIGETNVPVVVAWWAGLPTEAMLVENEQLIRLTYLGSQIQEGHYIATLASSDYVWHVELAVEWDGPGVPRWWKQIPSMVSLPI